MIVVVIDYYIDVSVCVCSYVLLISISTSFTSKLFGTTFSMNLI